MFLLSNIHNKNYKKCYPTESDVIFDISEKQRGNIKNAAWNELREGSIVCVVTGTKKVSTFCKVTGIKGLGDSDSDGGETFLLFGVVIAKLIPESNMGLMLSKFSIKHQYLPNNKFSVGFNVADLGSALDTLQVRTRHGSESVGNLKIIA